MPHKVDYIVTHLRPHLDEIASIWFLRIHGREYYPGIEQAKVIPYSRVRHEDGRSEQEWLEQDRTVFLGVRGGRWDHHPHELFPEDCTFTLVLKSFGLRNDRRFRELANGVLNEDVNAGMDMLYLANLIKNEYHAGFTFDEVYSNACFGLRAIERRGELIQAGMDYLAEHRSKWFRPEINTVRGFNVELWICVVPTEKYPNPYLNQAAKLGTRGNPGADLFIQVQPTGNVQIFGNKSQGINNLAPLAAALRCRQLQVEGKPLPTDVDFQCEGNMPGVPHFFLQGKAGNIYNGSLTAEDVPPTTIPIKEVIHLARDFLRNYPGPIARFNHRVKLMQEVTA